MIAILLAAACAGDCAAEKAYRALESRVLASQDVRLHFTTSARGATTAAFRGELDVLGPRAHVEARGSLQGKGVSPTLALSGRKDAEGLLLGLLRMGITHNLVQLSTSGAADLASARAMAPAAFSRTSDGALAWTLSREGKRVAEVKLWLDGRGLPTHRNLTMHLPGGEMKVHEEYARFTVETR